MMSSISSLAYAYYPAGNEDVFAIRAPSPAPPPSYEKAAADKAPPFGSNESTLHGSDIVYNSEGQDTYEDLDHAWGPPRSHRRSSTSSRKPAVHRAASVAMKVIGKGVRRLKNFVKSKSVSGSPRSLAPPAYLCCGDILQDDDLYTNGNDRGHFGWDYKELKEY